MTGESPTCSGFRTKSRILLKCFRGFDVLLGSKTYQQGRLWEGRDVTFSWPRGVGG